MKKNRGLTLTEVLVASAILMVMVLLAMGVFLGGMTSANTASKDAELAGRGRWSLERIREEIAYAKITGIFDDHRRIRYQIPVDHDGDGDIIDDATGTTEFGYWNTTGSGQTLGTFGEILATPTEVLRETNGPSLSSLGVPERQFQMDLNRDGDTNDSFAVCKLTIQVLDAGGTATFIAGLGDYVVLTPSSVSPSVVLDGDVNSNGNDDPMFRLEDATGIEVSNAAISTAARRLHVKVYHGGFAADGKIFILRLAEEQIRLEQRQD